PEIIGRVRQAIALVIDVIDVALLVHRRDGNELLADVLVIRVLDRDARQRRVLVNGARRDVLQPSDLAVRATKKLARLRVLRAELLAKRGHVALVTEPLRGAPLLNELAEAELGDLVHVDCPLGCAESSSARGRRFYLRRLAAAELPSGTNSK